MGKPAAGMRFHIDRFSKLGGAFIVHGWADCFKPGKKLTFTANGIDLETVTRAISRPDIPPNYGPGSERWGFRAYGIENDGATHGIDTVGLRFATGDTIPRLVDASPPAGDRRAAILWDGFVAEVNARGGRLVEIGSRARSGNTIRDLFGPNVVYIGVDVTAGPNVDIVADAHHLSEVISEPVDFVCSSSTFEHFIMPWKVALEANRILKPGGRIYSHSHQSWPEHDMPFDYFRFSEQAWAGLFNVHTGFRIIDAQSGYPVSIAPVYNVGGSFDGLELSSGHGMTTCVAERISEPLVAWDAPVSMVRNITYDY